jgi:SAM-dependent methyltransferase
MIRKVPDASSTPTAVSAVSACPVCGSDSRTDFFQVQDIPVHVGVLWDTAEQARRAPAGAITLTYCGHCGFVQNRALEQGKIVFEPGYEVALHHSKVFRDFTEEVATRLIDRYQVREREVLEIGCGCGYFLRRICDLGGNDCIGIDPTVPVEGFEQRERGSIQFIRDYFSDEYSSLECDLICCLSVFEDIPNPVEFVQRVRRIAERRERVPVYFEVFNGFRALESCETWSIHYEQCNYFSLESLSNIFRRCGFEILHAGTCYQDGQYLFVEAVLSDQPSNEPRTEPASGCCLPEVIAGFAGHHDSRLATWNRRFDEFARDGKRVVVWGSGGKGISFLNTVSTCDTVEFVVDINPDRQGKYIPGSAQRIVDPSFLTEYRPDAIILTNVLYEKEIKRQVNDLGLTSEFLVA